MGCNITEICSFHLTTLCDVKPPPDPPFGHPLHDKFQAIKHANAVWREYSRSCLGIEVSTVLPQASTVLPNITQSVTDITQSVTDGVTEIIRTISTKPSVGSASSSVSGALDWIIPGAISIVCIAIIFIIIIVIYKTCHSAKDYKFFFEPIVITRSCNGWRDSSVKISWVRSTNSQSLRSSNAGGTSYPPGGGEVYTSEKEDLSNTTMIEFETIHSGNSVKPAKVIKTRKEDNSQSAKKAEFTDSIPHIDLSVCTSDFHIEIPNEESGTGNLKNVQNLSLCNKRELITPGQDNESFIRDELGFNSLESDLINDQNSDCGYFTNSIKTCDTDGNSAEELCNNAGDGIVVVDKITGDRYSSDVHVNTENSQHNTDSSPPNHSCDPYRVVEPTEYDISVSDGKLARPKSPDIPLAPVDGEISTENRNVMRSCVNDSSESTDVKTNQTESYLSHTDKADKLDISDLASNDDTDDGVGNMTLSPSMELRGDLHEIINGAFDD